MSEELGYEERQGQNYRYVNLRLGIMAETRKETLDGFSPAKTTNKAGTVFNFFARRYEFITGYIDSIAWHTHDFTDGGKAQGWNILLNTGEQKFMLFIDSKDRPYSRTMSTLLKIDFNEPVRFNGFMGKHKITKKPQKVLLLYQGGEKPVQPQYPEKWVSLELQRKIKEKEELSEDDLKHLHLKADGKEPDWLYPHIIQNRDETWNFQTWENFLIEQVELNVIPAVQVAAAKRQSDIAFSGPAEEEAVVEDSSSSGPSDDDIPF